MHKVIELALAKEQERTEGMSIEEMLAEPFTIPEPTEEELRLAGEAIDRMDRHKAWYETLSPADKAVEDQWQMDAVADWIMNGPGGD